MLILLNGYPDCVLRLKKKSPGKFRKDEILHHENASRPTFTFSKVEIAKDDFELIKYPLHLSKLGPSGFQESPNTNTDDRWRDDLSLNQ